MRDPFFICTAPRSGCNFFMSLLMSTQKVGRLDEYLSRTPQRDWTDEDVLLFFERISRGAVEGEWGTKVDIRELSFVERYLSLKQIPLDSVRWIWLRRRDKIRQAISHIKAADSGIWHIFADDSADRKDKARAEGEISIQGLNEITLLYFLADDAWQQFFEKNNLTPHTIYYEDFIEEFTWAPLITGVLDFLQIPYTLPLDLTTSRVKVASDALSLSYKQFINQDLFEKRGYGDELFSNRQ